MSISVSSAKVMSGLYNNNNGKTTFYTGTDSRKTVKVNTEVEKSISINSDLQKAIRGLKHCNFDTGLKADIKKYTKKLVDGFNKFLENDGNGTKRYASKKNELYDLFDEYSQELSKAGITLKDNKVKFDTLKFASAEMNDLKDVLSINSDFITSGSKILNSMNNMVKNEVYQTVKEDIFVSNRVDSSNIKLAGNTNSLAVSINELLNTQLADDNSNESSILSLVYGYIDKINAFYDEITSNTEIEYSEKANDYINSIIDLNNRLGEESKKDPFPYNDLFNKEDPSSYGNQVQQLYQNLFSELVNTSAKDFEITGFIDYQI